MKKYNLKNIWSFIQGKVRYKLFYSTFAFSDFIKPHIKEQIEARIRSMDKKCYDDGQCKLCGCQTTALQMANKPCDKPCYPRMLSKSEWAILKCNRSLEVDGIKWGVWNHTNSDKLHFYLVDTLFKACEADIVNPVNIGGHYILKIDKQNKCKDE